ncbi:Retinol dehydrogenase 14 [Physocladia obscura]|uniref:Retinol dehydrogenase 14 n=1 Tax=Physocladia obscura TaxID=109957 RepID=A0AAD5T400_9FUNG|nr:Retinol dehydrogenase 14 [Physocladia obscura]
MFQLNDIPDLKGKTVMVTGATAGLGKASCTEFARKGAHVIVLGRNAEKCAQVIEEIKQKTGSELVEFYLQDLDDLESVRAFCKSFLARANTRLDILMLNAGFTRGSYALTKQGIESSFGVNYVAHFYMVYLLESLILACKTRIVSVSAGMINPERVNDTLEEMNNKATFDGLVAYGRSKAANIIFAKAMARKYADAGVISSVIEPGAVATDGPANLDIKVDLSFHGVVAFWCRYALPYFGASISDGIRPQMFAAVSPHVVNGVAYSHNCKKWNKANNFSTIELEEQLWTHTLELLAEKHMLKQ